MKEKSRIFDDDDTQAGARIIVFDDGDLAFVDEEDGQSVYVSAKAWQHVVAFVSQVKSDNARANAMERDAEVQKGFVG